MKKKKKLTKIVKGPSGKFEPLGPKNYAVKIEYHYLLKAHDQHEAIGMAMDRLLGRKFNSVFFNGMVTSAEITKETPESKGIMENFHTEVPVIKAKERCKLHPYEDADDCFYCFDTNPRDGWKPHGAMPLKKGSESYGIKFDGDRADTKEQDYIHLDTTDQLQGE